MMDEILQLYNNQGAPLEGRGASKKDILSQAILHAVSHVWIWRRNSGKIDILLQKRAADKPTWPSSYDISAAGHIRLGETPLEAAVREAKEEINLDIKTSDIKLLSVFKAYLEAGDGLIENEFQWIYCLELTGDVEFSFTDGEVQSLIWLSMDDFEASYATEQYVPHGRLYYETVISAIKENASVS